MNHLLFGLYWLAVLGLCLYGINCYVLCVAFRRRAPAQLRRLAQVRAAYWARGPADHDLPFVTVQLPIYNERYVVERLIRAVAAFDYPRSRFEIQVLDDSTDDTAAIAGRLLDELGRQGLAVSHVRRERREGFKAGALRDGLLTARGELVAIFDADFVPAPDYLRQSVPFFADERVGLVQARWGHLNRDYSGLTRAQGLAIDGHFSIEQAGRCWSGWMLNFNGTAGMWRRTAIESAGGWHADTLTEDLDLSYRAQLAGWKVEFLLDHEVLAELPADMSAFKSQQRRWAKGSIQTAMKLLPRVLRSPLPRMTKLQAVLHLTHYVVHPLMLTVALLAVPVLFTWKGGRASPGAFLVMAAFLTVGSCGPTALYVASQRALRPDWRRRLRHLPLLMLLGTGIAVSNARAVFEALLRIDSGFVRTPKRNLTNASTRGASSGYRLPVDAVFVMEAAIALYSAWGVTVYVQSGRYLIGPFLALYAASFGYVALLSMGERLRLSFSGAPTLVPEAVGSVRAASPVVTAAPPVPAAPRRAPGAGRSLPLVEEPTA